MIDHARIVFVTVLHGDYACTYFTFTESTATCTTARRAGFVRFRRLHLPQFKPHETVLRHKSTLLTTIEDREGTFGACTPCDLLSVTHTGPPVQSGIFRLAELVSFYLLPVSHWDFVRPGYPTW